MRTAVLAVKRALTIGALGYLAAAALAPGFGPVDSNVVRPHAPHSPVGVLAEHSDQCWTGLAPEGVVPTHVIWQHPDGHTVYSARLTGPALDTLFADGHLRGTAVAFCR